MFSTHHHNPKFSDISKNFFGIKNGERVGQPPEVLASVGWMSMPVAGKNQLITTIRQRGTLIGRP